MRAWLVALLVAVGCLASTTGLAQATTGSISADPPVVYVARDGTGTTAISWSTNDGTAANVWVSVNGEPEKLFASGPSGRQVAPWIVEGRARFIERTQSDGRQLAAVDVQGIRAGSLSASQQHVVVPDGRYGATTISWSMADGSDAQVWVSVNGQAETLFASGATGSRTANWIQRGSTIFLLYRGTEHREALDALEVTGDPPAAVPSQPGPCDLSPVDGSVRLTVRIRGSHRRIATTRYHRRVRVTGRLTTTDGSPVAGAAVCVAGRSVLAGGAVPAPDSIVTNTRGGFSYKVPPGPSRLVEFVHRTAAGAVSASVMVRVRAPVTFRASRRTVRRGQPLLLLGRLGSRTASRGLLVEVQGRRGHGWQTFHTTRIGRNARFRLRYRFTRTIGVRSYRLRARVPAQPGLAFTTGASRPITVHVRG